MIRSFIAMLFLVGVVACDRGQKSRDPTASAVPAQVGFDGADYKDNVAKIAHGKRLAVLLDCTGCHRSDFQGQNITRDDPRYGEMNAPNVTLLLARYSDAGLERVIRHGVPKDRREFWFLPVESFQFLGDADLAALIAYLRTFNPAGKQLPPIVKGEGFYEDVQKGFGNAESQVRRYAAEQSIDIGGAHEKGRYVAMVVCTACHNNDLQGYEGFSPNLDIAGVYSEDELKHLLTTGEGKVKKDLGMMSEMARNHFSQLTPRERDDLIRYIKARAAQPQ